MEVGAALGEVREVSMGQGSVRYRDVGRGEPILFVHGVLVDCELWGTSLYVSRDVSAVLCRIYCSASTRLRWGRRRK